MTMRNSGGTEAAALDNGQSELAGSQKSITRLRRAGSLTIVAALGAGVGFGIPLLGFLGLMTGIYLRQSAQRSARLRRQILGARPQDIRRLRAVVDEVSKAAGIAPPQRVVVLADAPPNAAASRFGRKGKGTIIASASLLHLLEPAELRAVVAHELTHLRHADSRYIVAPMLGTAAVDLARGFIPFAALWLAVATAGFSLSLLWAPALAFVSAFVTVKYATYLGASLAARTAQNTFKRSLERRADRTAATLTSGPALASGLRRITVQSQVASPNARLRAKLLGMDPNRKPNVAQRAATVMFADHPSVWARNRDLMRQAPPKTLA